MDLLGSTGCVGGLLFPGSLWAKLARAELLEVVAMALGLILMRLSFGLEGQAFDDRYEDVSQGKIECV